jgi:phage shock protein PspC (stress-responsive transcriptional regulator)
MTTGNDIPLTAPGDTTRELRRPKDDRMVAGVAAGLAEYFGLRPAIYRIAFAALALVGGAGILLYVVAALVIPTEGADESVAEDFLRRHRDRPGMLVALGIAGVIAIAIVSSPGRDWGWPLAGPAWFLLVVLGAVAVAHVSRRDREPRTGTGADAGSPRPERRSLFLPGLGILLAAAGVAALLDLLDVVDIRLDVALAVGLVLVGVLIAVGAFFYRVAGLIPLALVLAAGLAATTVANIGHGGPIGDVAYQPTTAAQIRDEYRLRIGRLEVDLRDVEFPAGPTRVDAEAGIGKVIVRVPEGVAVDATADVDYGEVDVLGRERDGRDSQRRVIVPGTAGTQGRVVIDAHLAIGRVEIVREAA